jgi:hypothetical protein
MEPPSIETEGRIEVVLGSWQPKTGTSLRRVKTHPSSPQTLFSVATQLITTPVDSRVPGKGCVYGVYLFRHIRLTVSIGIAKHRDVLVNLSQSRSPIMILTGYVM